MSHTGGKETVITRWLFADEPARIISSCAAGLAQDGKSNGPSPMLFLPRI